jgi:hypothetical protein
MSYDEFRARMTLLTRVEWWHIIVGTILLVFIVLLNESISG